MRNPPSRPAPPGMLLVGAAEPVRSSPVPFRPTALPTHPVPDPSTKVAPARQRLVDLAAHLHCSVIGTCLSTGELRKAMGRFMRVDTLGDLEVHHEAVRLASTDATVGHALNKLLDRRHDATVQRFARVKDPTDLAALWKQALAAGEIPGAYWAVLTHRRTTPALRQQVFGDVHMLSHLVGAANRADIRRLVALEAENVSLRDRADRLQERVDTLIVERDRGVDDGLAMKARIEALEQAVADSRQRLDERGEDPAGIRDLCNAVALQTQRREAAESRAQLLEAETARLLRELEHQHEQMLTMGHELGAAEAELHRQADVADDGPASAARPLSGRRLLYVGGRPSAQAAIRDVVLRQGGEFQRHGGGLEDRKGLLAPAIGWADLVVFPVDCIDHDSALNLKRACQRQTTPFIPLRSASVASFAAAIAMLEEPRDHGGPVAGGTCLRHG